LGREEAKIGDKGSERKNSPTLLSLHPIFLLPFSLSSALSISLNTAAIKKQPLKKLKTVKHRKWFILK